MRTLPLRVVLPVVLASCALACGGIATSSSERAPADASADVLADAKPMAEAGEADAPSACGALHVAEIIVPGQTWPHYLSVVSGHLLWIDHLPAVEKGFTQGLIWESSSDGADAAHLTTSGSGTHPYVLRGLSVDADHAWSARETPSTEVASILRTSRDGTDSISWHFCPCSPPGSTYEVIGGDLDSIYWRECGWLMRGSKTQPNAEKWVEDATNVRIALVDQHALWLVRCHNGCAIEQYMKGQTTPAIVADSTDPIAMVDDADSLYWIDGTAQAVQSVSKAGGTVSTLASVGKDSFALAVNGSHVVWVDSPPIDRIRAVPKAGGAVVTLACVPTGSSTIAADDQWVYFSEEGPPNPETGAGWIARVPAP